jgi:hypothetical protein
VVSPSQGSSGPSSGPAGTVQSSVAPPAGEQPVTPTTPFPGVDATNPLSIFFNYGRYDIVDVTNELLGQGQSAKLTKFVADATAVKASEIIVNGYASPEDNLANSQLPLHRATALKNRLDQLFASGPVRPTVSVRTTSVLAGSQATWPSLRRADIYITARAG